MSAPAPPLDPLACERFYDNRYAGDYMQDWPARKLERVRSLIAELPLPVTGTAVDFGCGIGTFTAVLRDGLAGWRIVGADVSSVAVAKARQAVSGCEFHHIDPSGGQVSSEGDADCMGHGNVAPGSVDFLFTHHVLEHVADLEQSWAQMTSLMRPDRACMLHVLPCGNPGSFEHELCSLRVDGIDRTRQGRFFYEDPGHLRRLQTQELRKIAGQFGFHLAQAYYSHHRIEAIDWLSGNGLRFVRDLCDPAKAIDAPARRELVRLRRMLMLRAVVKAVARRDAGVMWPLAKIAQVFTNHWTRAAEQEWQQMRSQSHGSEMYMIFRRGPD